MDISQFKIPGYLPDCEAVRNDFYQYFQRLQEFDGIIGSLRKQLEAAGELEILSLLLPPTTALTCRAAIPTCTTPGRASFLLFAGEHISLKGARLPISFF